MYAQQLLDQIIKPSLGYLGDSYNTKDAQMMLLATAAIESNCGYYIKQVRGPALGIWQMEPATHDDIWAHCDALQEQSFRLHIRRLQGPLGDGILDCLYPMYACSMARLKYSMDRMRLPNHKDISAVYDYYKRVYNTPAGASTMEKFIKAWDANNLSEVSL